MKVELFTHQKLTAEFLSRTPRALVTSDPGTGKTLSCLEGYQQTGEGKMLVLAPLSILEPAWGGDVMKFTDYSYIVAHGKKREDAMRSRCNIVITNHDAVKWIAKDPSLLDGFTHLVVDEFTAFKNRTSQRSKALLKIANKIDKLWMLSGTPNSNSILDLWFPAFLLDKGERLGKRFWEFRSQVCTAVQVGPSAQHLEWRDRPGVEMDVADRLKDITIRFKFEDCIDTPPNAVHDLQLEMPQWVKRAYIQLKEASYLETEDGVITSIHAGAQVRKLLQLLSGAVYDADGEPIKVHDDRYKLVMDLIAERDQCVVAFNWKHELNQLTHWAEKYGFSYAVINGDASPKDRTRAVKRFQAGEIKVIFAHPQAAGHGLTLTAGTTTIWCSPTYNAEHYNQLNSRIYRAGQKKKTETLRVAYKDSLETEVYEKLEGKMTRMTDLLSFMKAFGDAA
ncbi:MAG: helicase-related protein [Cellvibrionaceae bacterium]